MSTTLAAPAPVRAPRESRSRRPRRQTSLWAHGEPFVWLAGGAMAVCLLMILGLLAFVFSQGFSTFWPRTVVKVQTLAGKQLQGEIATVERYRPADDAFQFVPTDMRDAVRERVTQLGGESERRMLRIENFELTGEHYAWVSDFEIARETEPHWAVLVERRSGGRFYGEPRAFLVDGKPVEMVPEAVWRRFESELGPSRERFEARQHLEKHELGDVNARIERERLALRKVELEHGHGSAEFVAAEQRCTARQAELQHEYDAIGSRIRALDQENRRQQLVLITADGRETEVQVSEIVRAFPPNQLGFGQKLGVYLSRWGEFLGADPRESNSEGGVFPAIFGTVLMTLIMSCLVVPFGVLAALYLREYARPGLLVTFVRIAVNNLAGVPSIVFGVFGFGFFCVTIGTTLDQLFFAEKLPSPTYGTGGLMWASLTLALLTLPVVIVATEEALSAVPGSMREGSYACGATKWQTIRRIVLPRALPGIMTGMILAIARGAGEVAPLMLVGAVKLAPALPLDSSFPFVHPERSFLHLGFQIFDLGFQSQNSEAAKPMVYTTTLLLIVIIVLLNLTAIWVRGRLRRRFATVQI